MKHILYLSFGFLYLMLTFFGFGPIFLADGTEKERFITICIVVFLYTILTVILRWAIKMMNKNG